MVDLSFKCDWIAVLIFSQTIMDAHDDFMPVDIDVSLHEWHRFGQNIIASTYEINVEHLMIPDDTEYPLVII